MELIDRAGDWLDSLDERHERGGSTYITAITHASVIRAVIIRALEAAPASFWRIDIGPLTRTDLHGRDGIWTLRMANVPV